MTKRIHHIIFPALVLLALALALILSPRALAAEEGGAADDVLIAEDGTVTLRSDHAAAEGVSSVQLKLTAEAAEGESLGLLSIFGATISPMGIMPKELTERANRRNSTKIAAMVFAGAIVISAIMLGLGYFRLYSAKKDQKDLRDRIAELEPVREIYEENTYYRGLAEQYISFDGMTKTQAEKTLQLIQDLEEKLPTTVVVESMTVTNDNVLLNMKCDEKMTVAQLLLNMKELNYLTNINIPSIARETSMDEEGVETVTGWKYSMTATLIDPPSAVSAAENE